MSEKLSYFFRQNLLLLASLYVMTFGVSLFLRSNLGSSAISSIPYVWSLAGADNVNVSGWQVPQFTVGGYTVVMNAIFVLLQILILRRAYKPLQLFQLLIGALFSVFLDVNMYATAGLTSVVETGGFLVGLLLVLIGGAVMGFGVACEVRCKSVMMPGEGIQVAIAQVSGREFSKIKIIVDVSLVIIGVTCGFIFYGCWRWDIIGIGTLISMVYIGLMVRLFSRHLAWFDSLLYTPETTNAEETTPVTSEHAKPQYKKVIPLVITISRQRGSGGREVGEKVANRLGMSLYDSEILLRTAQDLNIEPGEVANREQNLSTPRLFEKFITDDYIPQGTVLSTDDKLFISQSRFIRSVSEQEPCVIIGRCADHVLANRPNVLRIFIMSDIDFAARRVIKSTHDAGLDEISMVSAIAHIEEVNKSRSNHYLRYTGKRWGDASNYDIVLNTSSLGIERCVELICSVALREGEED